MIYLFAGDDATTRHKAYEKFIATATEGVETFFISRNDFDKVHVESLYSGAGLFFSKCNVVFTQVLEHEDIADFILEKLPVIAESQNDFIFLEGKLKKPVLDAFKKALPTGRQAVPYLNIYDLSKEKKEKFDNFLLATAFSNKDKVNLWIYFRQAMDRGVGMEELVGVLFWKAKDMILKKNFGKFKESELQNFTSKISYLLPEARRDGLDDEAAFERFLLEAF